MTSRAARPSRLVRRLGNGHFHDTVEGTPVTLEFVVDLVWLGEEVSIFDEMTREDRTYEVLAPAIFARLRSGADSPRSVEGVALARAIKALGDLRAEFERMGERITGLERLLQAATRQNADAPPAKSAIGVARE
jgi:polyhydroxyalkanoate synthesis regulator protein